MSNTRVGRRRRRLAQLCLRRKAILVWYKIRSSQILTKQPSIQMRFPQLELLKTKSFSPLIVLRRQMSSVCMGHAIGDGIRVCHKSGLSYERIACIQSCRLIDCDLRTPFLISLLQFGNCDCERITMLDIGVLHSFPFPGIGLSTATIDSNRRNFTVSIAILFQFFTPETERSAWRLPHFHSARNSTMWSESLKFRFNDFVVNTSE